MHPMLTACLFAPCSYVGNIDASITDSEGLRSLFADFPGLISAKLVKVSQRSSKLVVAGSFGALC
jgi:hypothetical protein